jgi:Trypsin-co-occurring domain 1
MAEERRVTIELGDDLTMVVVAEEQGPELVSAADVVAKLGAVTGSIEKVGRELLEAVKRASPTKATVELGFGLAIEAGQLVALFGKGKGEASITVTLEWSAKPSG